MGATIEIEASAADVWGLLAEFEHWPKWGPTVRKVESEAAGVAPGVTGRVKTIVGPWLPFEITDVVPGRSWHWKVSGIAATGHFLSELEDERTLVEFTVPAFAAPYVVVLRTGLKRLKELAEGDAV